MATNRALDGGGRDYVDTLLSFTWPGETKRDPALPGRVGDRVRVGRDVALEAVLVSGRLDDRTEAGRHAKNRIIRALGG